MAKIEPRRSKSSGDKTQKPDYSGLGTNQKWMLGSWGVMEPAVQDGPFLIGNRSSNGGCSIAVITPQNIIFLKKSHTHTHKQLMHKTACFFHPSETVTFWGVLSSWCPKKTPILKDGVNLEPAICRVDC